MTGTDDLVEVTSALAPGFAVECEIGRGGMGVVYRALDVALDRQVAIKVLPTSRADPDGVRERFLREGRTAAKLSHPNIVPIYRADEIDGMAFLVMGFVDGPSLGDRLASQGTLSPADTARILSDVASALDYAHARGVIHRDIKPENVLLERVGGRALVTDFGIAQVAAATPLTQTGQVLGTAHYMSPEQVNGEPVDGRSDLYALGVMGFRMLTGRLPFDNAVASAIMVAHVTRAAPPIRDLAPHVPAALAAVIERCMRKSPVDRFASGAALCAALAACGDMANASSVVGTSPAATSGPALLSAQEKDAVLARAAELQDATGTQPAIRPSPLRRDGNAPARDEPTATRGYPLANVAAAAEEVGIDRRYVARAVAELGLSGPPSTAATVDRGDLAPASIIRGPTQRLLGLPVSVSRTLELDGPLDDREWERLVADLRETFDTTGVVRQDGSLRQWSHGNLTATVEPGTIGYRVRVRTLKEAERALIGLSLGPAGIAATVVAIVAAHGVRPGHGPGAIAGAGVLGMIGLGMFGLSALRLPRWARRRRKQFEEVLARVARAHALKAGQLDAPARVAERPALKPAPHVPGGRPRS